MDFQSYLRKKTLRKDIRHSLWLKVLHANLYVESFNQSPTMKSSCFLEFSSIMESAILDLEAYPPICLYVYIYSYSMRSSYSHPNLPPPCPSPNSVLAAAKPPHAPSPNSVLAAAEPEFGSQLPIPSVAAAKLPAKPDVGGCPAAKPELGSCHKTSGPGKRGAVKQTQMIPSKAVLKSGGASGGYKSRHL